VASPLSLDYISSGPYALIFSEFVFFYYHVPMTSRQTFSMFGLTFSWKAAVKLINAFNII
jgi:hypothetical protein